DPGPTEVTDPLVSTVAMARLSLVQRIRRPDTRLPVASRSVVVNRVFALTTRVTESGVTDNEATGTGGPTVTAAVPRAGVYGTIPVITTVPPFTPMTRPTLPGFPPFDSARAAVESLVDHSTYQGSTWPAASRTVGVREIRTA